MSEDRLDGAERWKAMCQRLTNVLARLESPRPSPYITQTTLKKWFQIFSGSNFPFSLRFCLPPADPAAASSWSCRCLEEFELAGRSSRESRRRWDGRGGHTLSQDHPRASRQLGGHPWVDSTGLNRFLPPLKKFYRFRFTCHKSSILKILNRSAGPHENGHEPKWEIVSVTIAAMKCFGYKQALAT